MEQKINTNAVRTRKPDVRWKLNPHTGRLDIVLYETILPRTPETRLTDNLAAIQVTNL